MRSYFYRAQLFKWFRSQTDGILEVMHNKFLSIIKLNDDFPISSISSYFGTDRDYKVDFDLSALLDHSLRIFLLHLLYIETQGISPFNIVSKNYAPHIDHIYPKSKLQRAPFDLNSSEINHIGNYRIVGASDNIRKRAEEPASYFTKLSLSNASLTKRHLLLEPYASQPQLLSMDLATYINFRDNRVNEIFNKLAPIINYI
jgi:hypothetical protein